MTPEERAGYVRLTGIAGEIRTRIAAAIRAAVEAECNRCELIALRYRDQQTDAAARAVADDTATAIRERKS